MSRTIKWCLVFGVGVFVLVVLGQSHWQKIAVASKDNHHYTKPPKVMFSESREHKRVRMFEGPLPGMPKHPWALATRMEASFTKKGKRYKPRTHHFWTNKLPRFTNRLIFETSPYLLQHAHNPVNWYPWGKAAFVRAKKEKKPVFLSVGYSTCHWCHVMERESFENTAIAAYLNKHYICIKVDREERLDVDGIYMRAVQMFTRGGGGWPMSVWLTPQRQPFYGGTYFPPKDRWGRRGFLHILKLMADRFRRDPKGVARQARTMAWRLKSMANVSTIKGMPKRQVLARAAELYKRYHDPINGGMRGRPKFPSSLSVSMMLRYAHHTGDQQALKVATKALKKMANGGIYDHIGGGFHRYSVDAKWLVPHFEKMLYDNALLTVAYLEGYQATKDPMFARVAKDILAYVMKERSSPGGAFYSATDADSEGHEGKFFVWTPKQIKKHLGASLAKKVMAYYNVTPSGNFEGKNIFHVTRSMAAVARSFKIPLKTFHKQLASAREVLYKARLKRVPPLSDNKIITSWNGLMISAFARAALVFQEPMYAAKAAKAAAFLLKNMRRRDGRLYRTYKAGQAKFNAYLEDYAFLIAGLLDLFEASQEPKWLKQALSLQRLLQKHHWDKRGGYFRTSQDHEKLIFRPKPNYDGAVPTGNSIQVMNLLRLHTMTTEAQYKRWALETFRYFGRRLTSRPIALSEMLLALDYFYDEPKEIILVKPHKGASVAPFLAAFKGVFLPARTLQVVTSGAHQKQLAHWLPLVAKKKPIAGKVTAYVCKRRVCELPTFVPNVFAKQLRKSTKWKSSPQQ